jgi:hypothetical protein
VSPVKYELGFYIPEDDILHSYPCENIKSYKFVLHARIDDCIPITFSFHYRKTISTKKDFPKN